LRIPLRRAIANSATTIACTAIIGAIYKNATLSMHGVSAGSALHLALLLAPTAVLGGYLGGRLTHVLPGKILRIAFIVLMTVVSIQTFRKSRQAGGLKSEIRISKSETNSNYSVWPLAASKKMKPQITQILLSKINMLTQA